MLVKRGEQALLAARADVEAAPDVVSSDYYAQHPQIRLTADTTGRPAGSEKQIEVILDGADVGRLVECAIRHPNTNMRYVVLAAIWNDPASFRQIFDFGLNAPEAFREIRDIVAEAIAQRAAPAEPLATTAVKALLPQMPLPPHLRNRSGD